MTARGRIGGVWGFKLGKHFTVRFPENGNTLDTAFMRHGS